MIGPLKADLWALVQNVLPWCAHLADYLWLKSHMATVKDPVVYGSGGMHLTDSLACIRGVFCD